MKEFVQIEFQPHLTNIKTRVLIRRSKINSVQIDGKSVQVWVDGVLTPFTFTYETYESARCLFQSFNDTLL